MEVKENHAFHTALDKMDLESPAVVILSGLDPEAFDQALQRARAILGKRQGPFETTVYSGEPGDDSAFLEEVFNIPLFSPYRLIAVRRAGETFKQILSSQERLARMETSFRNIPDRTWIFLQFEGTPSKKFLEIFGERLLHYPTRELTPPQMAEAIRSAEKKFGLHLEEEAIYELRERVEPRSGAIEMAMQRLHDLLPKERENRVSHEDIREILYPALGMNSFRLVDALFDGDHRVARRELMRFNPSVDNFFAIFKLILNRTDEIRRARVGFSHGMNDEEVLQLLELKSRPPFIQKKILSRLHREVLRFQDEELSTIYRFLIQTQRDFRGQTPPQHQGLIFSERILGIFFQ